MCVLKDLVLELCILASHDGNLELVGGEGGRVHALVQNLLFMVGGFDVRTSVESIRALAVRIKRQQLQATKGSITIAEFVET